MNFDTGVSILCEFAGDEDLLSLAYISDELALDGHFGAVGLRHGGSCGVVGLNLGGTEDANDVRHCSLIHNRRIKTNAGARQWKSVL
jgi:hypothetical protein